MDTRAVGVLITLLDGFMRSGNSERDIPWKVVKESMEANNVNMSAIGDVRAVWEDLKSKYYMFTVRPDIVEDTEQTRWFCNHVYPILHTTLGDILQAAFMEGMTQQGGPKEKVADKRRQFYPKTRAPAMRPDDSLFLLNLIQNYFILGKTERQLPWETITSESNLHSGVDRSVKQIMSRWENLKRQYRKVKALGTVPDKLKCKWRVFFERIYPVMDRMVIYNDQETKGDMSTYIVVRPPRAKAMDVDRTVIFLRIVGDALKELGEESCINWDVIASRFGDETGSALTAKQLRNRFSNIRMAYRRYRMENAGDSGVLEADNLPLYVPRGKNIVSREFMSEIVKPYEEFLGVWADPSSTLPPPPLPEHQ